MDAGAIVPSDDGRGPNYPKLWSWSSPAVSSSDGTRLTAPLILPSIGSPDDDLLWSRLMGILGHNSTGSNGCLA